ncbi:MAG: PAS domain S-box protein [Lentisphaeria bacterium]|nr:PAS domain S-box protein [Lentisphaeria bacterium]
MKLRPVRLAERSRKTFSGPHLYACLFRLAILLFLFCFAAIPLSAQDKRHFNILLIFSEHTASEIRTDLTGAYFNELANLGIMFESDLVELDSLHDQNQTSWDEKLSPKKEAIEAGKYKLIVTFGEPDTNTLKNILPIVPESTAVILSNMKTFPEEWRQIHPNTTAVIRQMDPRTNIKFGLKLFPNNPHVVLLVSPFGWSDRQDISLRNEFAGICDFTTIYIRGDSDTERDAAFRKLAMAPADAFIVSNDWDIYLPSIGSRSTMWYQLMQVRDDLPIIGRRRVLMDFAVGGYISSIEEVGKKTAALTGQLANSRGSLPAEKIAPVIIDETCVINYKRINYWQYDESAIPADAEWINKPQSWTERNQELLVTLAILFTVLCAFVLGGLIYFFKYRRMTSRFLAIHGHMPLLVAAYSTSGEVLYAHVPFNDPDASQNLDDLRTALTNTIRVEMAETAISGKTMTVNRKYGERNYTITLTKLDKRIFKHEAVLVVAQDTTEMAELREQSFNLATRLQLTLRAIGDGIIVTDRMGFVTMVNRAAEKLTGFTQTEAEGKTIQEVFNIASPEGSATLSPVETAIRENRIITNSDSLTITSKDGTKHRISTSTSPIRGAKNALLGAIIVFRDITEEYERREELDRKTHALQTATTLANLGYFYYTPDTDTFDAPSPSDAVWPFENGKHVPAENWIIAEDLQDYLTKRRALFHGKSDILECTFRSDFFGKRRHFRITAVKDKSARRKNQRFFFMLQDITKVRDLETEAANAMLFLKMLFDIMPNTVSVRNYNDEYRLLMANQKYCYQLKTTEDKLIGTNYKDIFDPELAKSFQDMDDEAVMRIGEVCTHQVDVPTHDGFGVAQISHVAFKDTSGRLLVFGCSSDVTELYNAIKAAESAAKAKSLFLATMSHEIRTPLNAILGFSNLLQDESLPRSEASEYLRSIHYAGNALLSLINDILDLSKLDADQMVIQPEPTNLRELMFELEAVFTAKAKSQGIDLITTVPDDLPVLNLDERRLRQVLLNLIGNAVKFTREGAVTVSLTFFKLNEKHGAITIRIADTGCGISKESLDKIFEPFVQDKTSYRGIRTENGTGLGLSIAKRLVDCMKGSLTVESTLGKGSVFTILLPEIEICADAELKQDEQTGNGQLDTSKKILVVDDVPLNVKVLCAMLRKMGFDPLSAPSGAKALELLTTTKPDIGLFDLWMPEMNGMELASAVRANPDWAGIKMYAVTADTENSSNFDMSMFDGIVMKPVTQDSLMKVLS